MSDGIIRKKGENSASVYFPDLPRVFKESEQKNPTREDVELFYVGVEYSRNPIEVYAINAEQALWMAVKEDLTSFLMYRPETVLVAYNDDSAFKIAVSEILGDLQDLLIDKVNKLSFKG